MKLKFDVKTKIWVLGFALVACFTGAQTYRNVFAIEKYNNADMNQRLDMIANTTAKGIEWYIQGKVAPMQSLAGLPEIVQMKADGAKPFLVKGQSIYKTSIDLTLTNMTGEAVAKASNEKLTNYGDRGYFKKISAENRDYGVEMVIDRVLNKPTLAIAVPVQIGSNRQGVLIGNYQIDGMSAVLPQKPSPNGSVYVMDEKGIVLAHSNAEQYKKMANFKEAPTFKQRPDQGKRLVAFNDGISEQLAMVQKTRNGWYVVAQQPESEAKAGSRAAMASEMLFSGFSLLLSLGAIIWLGLSLGNPIEKVALAAQKTDSEQLHLPEFASRNDEIGRAARSLQRLSATIAKINSLKKKRK